MRSRYGEADNSRSQTVEVVREELKEGILTFAVEVAGRAGLWKAAKEVRRTTAWWRGMMKMQCERQRRQPTKECTYGQERSKKQSKKERLRIN